MTTIKKHIDVCDDCCEDHLLSESLFTLYGGNDKEAWEELEAISKAQANYHKYKNRVAICLEVLVPLSIHDEDMERFGRSFINKLLHNESLMCACFLEERGKGRYLVYLIS